MPLRHHAESSRFGKAPAQKQNKDLNMPLASTLQILASMGPSSLNLSLSLSLFQALSFRLCLSLSLYLALNLSLSLSRSQSLSLSHSLSLSMYDRVSSGNEHPLKRCFAKGELGRLMTVDVERGKRDTFRVRDGPTKFCKELKN